MAILSDKEIEVLCIGEEHRPMINPYYTECIRYITNRFDAEGVSERKVMSFGQSSYGYDVRIGSDIRIFSNINSVIIDPKRLDERSLVSGTILTDDNGDEYVILPPHSYLLGATPEYFIVPRDIMIVCVGKSTYARAGILVNVTPIEPGFEGNVVIEISNSTPLPAKIYVGEGIAQFLFFRGNMECETSYDDRSGKYQGQTGVTLPRV